MGGKRREARSKFDRIYTDSESESSDNENLIDPPQNVMENENNSNSTETVKMSEQGKGVPNEKFLVTRSKRKYNKPELKLKFRKDKIESESKDSKESSETKESSQVKCLEPPSKKKRETIKSLDSKIEAANSFLQKLNQKLEDRDREISNLKKTISNERSQSSSSEIKNLLEGRSNKSPNDRENQFQFFPHDFPIIGDEDGESYEAETIDEEIEHDGSTEEIKEKEENLKRRNRSRSRSKDRKRKRSQSRSRSKSRNRGEKKGKEEDKINYRENSEVQKLVKRMVAEQVKEEMQKRQKLNNTSGLQLNNTLAKKSRSEATLYRPAVERYENLNGSPSPLGGPDLGGLFVDHGNYVDHDNPGIIESQFKNNSIHSTTEIQTPLRTMHSTELKKNYPVNPDEINNTLSQLRVFADENRRNTSDRVNQPTTSRNHNDVQQHEQIRNAHEAADRAIIEAERYKARIQQPNRGEFKFNNPKSPRCNYEEIKAMRYLDQEDDEFFHTTCHIEDTIREKIEKGKFVELEKLLQKRILQYNYKDQEHHRMQLINKDGMSYFVPSIDKETRIDGIKKWEQAFRVYTTIYCKANPERAGEILQYIDTIHRAAAIFNWDNVAKYDYVFRQLMATKPHRSWAKLYTQMWNLTLNEPIKKFHEGSGNYHNNSNHPTNKGSQKKKDSYCWKYNKNNCSYGKSCRFEHKCSYCGVHGHPVTSCHKKQGKKSSGNEKADKTKNN